MRYIQKKEGEQNLTAAELELFYKKAIYPLFNAEQYLGIINENGGPKRFVDANCFPQFEIIDRANVRIIFPHTVGEVQTITTEMGKLRYTTVTEKGNTVHYICVCTDISVYRAKEIITGLINVCKSRSLVERVLEYNNMFKELQR